jgi:hypothetical protein
VGGSVGIPILGGLMWTHLVEKMEARAMEILQSKGMRSLIGYHLFRMRFEIPTFLDQRAQVKQVILVFARLIPPFWT